MKRQRSASSQCVASKLVGFFLFVCFFHPPSFNLIYYLFLLSDQLLSSKLLSQVAEKPLPFIFISDARFVNEASAASAAYFSFLSRQAELKSKKAAESFALCIEKYNRVGGEFEQKMSESSQVSSSHCGHATVFLMALTPPPQINPILFVPHQKVNKKRNLHPDGSQVPTYSCAPPHPLQSHSTQFTASSLPWLLLAFLWKSSSVKMTETTLINYGSN